MSHSLYNKSVILPRSSQIVWIFSDNLSFYMASAYALLYFYANGVDLDCYCHMNQSANNHKGIWVRPASANSVSNQQ